MSSIDRRVVEMEFDNKQFERGIKDTLASLDALKKGLTLEGVAKGLKDVEEKGKRFNLGGMADAVENISSKFSALGAIGFTIIQNLTNSAIDFAKRTANLVWDPLISGGRRRALNIEQAKFQFRGLGVDVEEAMANALFAVEGTAFGLDEAARAASQLSASQVELGDDMRGALRGISGVAAMTNSSYEDTARIFTRVAGQGRVMAVDLNSIASRGLNAAATLADAFGTTEAEIREMVTRGEVSFDMFAKAMDDAFGENATKANETYTGSLANMRAALARIGANFFGTWIEQQRDLFNALTPAIDGVNEALQPMIARLLEFTGIRTDKAIASLESFDSSELSDALKPLLGIIENLGASAGAIFKAIRLGFRTIFPETGLRQLTTFLEGFERFTERLLIGGETAENLRRTFAGVFAIFGIGFEVLKAAAKFFFELFGIAFEGNLGFLSMTANIGDFLVAMHTAIKEGEGLTNFFSALVDFLKPAVVFIKDFAKALVDISSFDGVESAERLRTAFAEFEPLTKLGQVVGTVWTKAAESWERIWGVFRPMADALGTFFAPIISGISEAFSDLDFDRIIDIINTSLFGGFLVVFNRLVKNMGSGMGSAIHRLTAPFGRLTYTLNTMQTTLRAMTLMNIAIAVGILTASVVALSKIDAAGLTKALTAISAMFTQLFVAMAGISRVGGVTGLTGIGTGMILFAIALRILVSSVRALANLEWEGLAKGLTGVTALIAVLVAATRGLTGQAKGMIVAGVGLTILATGIRILATSVTALSGLSWEDMARGLTGVGALLASLAIFTRIVAANKAGVLQGTGLILLATAIRILASSVKEFAQLSPAELSKGLVSVGAILAGFAGFSHILDPKGLVRAGVSLVLIGAAMKILASAMGDFAGLSWGEIAKGLASMAGALLAIVVALNLMPPSTLASATSLVMVSFALGLIATALGRMGGMSWEEIAKGLVTLGGSLAIIAVAMFAMTGALAGAAATLVVATALRMLAPVLERFGKMSWGEMGKGLLMLAGVFVVLGLAGLVLTPVVPTLMGLGIAIALVGAGTLLAAAGVLAFATAVTALAAVGALGTAAVVAMATALIGLLPVLARGLAEALVVFVQVIAHAAPEMLEAMVIVMNSILDGIIEVTPKIIETIIVLVQGILETLRTLVPDMAQTGLEIMVGVLKEFEKNAPTITKSIGRLIVGVLNEMAKGARPMARAATDLIVAVLNGIRDNIGRVITAGADIVIAFVRGISDNMVRIADEGFQAVISFINGIADSIRRNAPELREAGRNLASAMLEGITGGLSGGVSRVTEAARGVASSALEGAKSLLGISSPSKEFLKLGQFTGEGLALGLKKSETGVEKSAEELGKEAIRAMKESLAATTGLFATDMDLHPTITPVLDLSEFRKDAAEVGASLKTEPVSVSMAYEKAKDASHRYISNRQAQETPVPDTVDHTAGPGVVFNQYNQSPKALSEAEIYRQTKNQLSTTKGALTPNAVKES